MKAVIAEKEGAGAPRAARSATGKPPWLPIYKHLLRNGHSMVARAHTKSFMIGTHPPEDRPGIDSCATSANLRGGSLSAMHIDHIGMRQTMVYVPQLT